MKVRLWNAKTGELKQTLAGHSHWVWHVAFTRDGNGLASGSVDRTVRFWDVKTGEHQQTLDGFGGFIRSMAISPEGNTLAVGDTHITFLTREAGVWKHRRKIVGHTGGITSLAFSSDGETLGSASEDGTVLMWHHDAAPPAAISTVRIKPSWVTSPPLGHMLEFSIVIESGENVAGFEATVILDPTALRYVDSRVDTYYRAFSQGPVHVFDPVVEEDRFTIRAKALDGVGKGWSTLATLRFEVLAAKISSVKLLDVSLMGPDGKRTYPRVEDGRVVEPPR